MSSLAKIGPDQKSLKNSGRSAKFWPTKLVIWLAVETPEVKMPSWLRGALAKSSRLIRHKCTKNFAPFCSYNPVDGATWFYLYKWRYAIWNISWLVQNRVWISGTSEISDSVVELCGHGVESILAQTSLMFWKLNSWFFRMAMKADAYWFPGWDKGHIYQQEEMLIKSQVTRMHVLNICVSNGSLYLFTVHDTVCLHTS